MPWAKMAASLFLSCCSSESSSASKYHCLYLRKCRNPSMLHHLQIHSDITHCTTRLFWIARKRSWSSLPSKSTACEYDIYSPARSSQDFQIWHFSLAHGYRVTRRIGLSNCAQFTIRSTSFLVAYFVCWWLAVVPLRVLETLCRRRAFCLASIMLLPSF